MLKEQGKQENGGKLQVAEEVKDEPKQEAQKEPAEAENEVPISTLLSKMDEAEEVQAPERIVEAAKIVEQVAEQTHPPAAEVEAPNNKEEKVEPAPKQKASKKQKQKQREA